MCELNKGNRVFKRDGFTFAIYYHSPYLVNVTGEKSFDRLKLARQTIENEMEQIVMKTRIDNTFCSQKNYRNVVLAQVYEFMQNNEDFHVDYKCELFSGMYFHPKKPNYPTILFFRTGSYTTMGGKCMTLIMECETFVNRLIKNLIRCIIPW